MTHTLNVYDANGNKVAEIVGTSNDACEAQFVAMFDANEYTCAYS